MIIMHNKNGGLLITVESVWQLKVVNWKLKSIWIHFDSIQHIKTVCLMQWMLWRFFFVLGQCPMSDGPHHLLFYFISAEVKMSINLKNSPSSKIIIYLFKISECNGRSNYQVLMSPFGVTCTYFCDSCHFQYYVLC